MPKLPPAWDLKKFGITHFEAVFFVGNNTQKSLATEIKIFPATKTSSYLGLKIFWMITHFEAVFFVGNNASNR